MPRLAPEVHWREGMPLQPHHLQLLQKHVRDLGAYLVNLRSFGYGVRTLRIREESVPNWVLEVDACDLVMPDGTVVIQGETAIVRAVEFRHLEHDADKLEVYLGVPFENEDMPNVASSGQIGEAAAASRRYVTESEARKDENTGKNEKPVEVRRLNVRIFVGARPPEGFATLKIAELKKLVSDDPPRRCYELSQDYVPACLRLDSAPLLLGFVEDMRDRLQSKNSELLQQLRGEDSALEGESMHAPATLIKLQATNGLLPMLHQLAAQPSLHPFDVYLQLTRLAGELAIFSDHWEPPRLVVYNHDHPLVAFKDLRGKWLELLEQAIETRIRSTEFVPSEAADGLLETVIPNRFLSEEVGLFLAVEPKQDLDAMFSGAKTVLAAPQDMPENPAGMRWPAIELEGRDDLPRAFALDKDKVFRPIKRSGEYWDHATMEKKLLLAGAGVIPGSTFYLYATNVREGDGDRGRGVED